jgi:hypothetical protein
MKIFVRPCIVTTSLAALYIKYKLGLETNLMSSLVIERIKFYISR